MWSFRGFFCGIVLAGALVGLTSGSAQAQVLKRYTPLHQSTGLNNFLKTPIGQPEPTTLDPTTWLSLRAGAMVAPRAAGLIGFDASFPRLSIGENWHGRLDVDVIIKASLANTDTAVPITFNQIYYRPQTGRTDVYAGFGLGVILGGDANFVGKLILGATLNSRASAEVNLNFTENDTLVMVLGRFRL